MRHPQREASIRSARKHLGDARIKAFLEAVHARSLTGDVYHGVTAIRIAVERMREGEDMDTLFRQYYFEDDAVGYGLGIAAAEQPTGAFRIDFDCSAGNGAGDGGSWLVTFGTHDDVVHILATGFWVR